MRKLVCALAAAFLSPILAFGQQLPDKSYLTLDEQSAWVVTSTRVGWQLQLSPTQKNAVNAAFEAYGTSEKQLFAQGAPSEALMEKLDHALATRVLAPLNSQQRARLHEIALQLKGVTALTDEQVARQVGLTAAKKDRIKAILEAADKRQEDFEASLATKLIAVPRIAPKSAYDKRRAAVLKSVEPQRVALEKKRKADEQKALEELTAPQRDRWTAMLGKPLG